MVKKLLTKLMKKKKAELDNIYGSPSTLKQKEILQTKHLDPPQKKKEETNYFQFNSFKTIKRDKSSKRDESKSICPFLPQLPLISEEEGSNTIRYKRMYQTTSKTEIPSIFNSTTYQYSKTAFGSLSPLRTKKCNQEIRRSMNQWRDNVQSREQSPQMYAKDVKQNIYFTKRIGFVSSPKESRKKQDFLEVGKFGEDKIISKKGEILQRRTIEFLKRIGSEHANKQIFCVNHNGDEMIKEILLKYGWIENNSVCSNIFHLKWIDNDSNRDYDSLVDGQYFNHFQNSQEICNQIKLNKNLKQYLQIYPEYSSFFLDSFDLSNPSQRQDFEKIFNQFQSYKQFQEIIQRIENILGEQVVQQINHIYESRCVQMREHWIHIELQTQVESLMLQIDTFTFRVLLKKIFEELIPANQSQFSSVAVAQIYFKEDLNLNVDEFAIIVGISFRVLVFLQSMFPFTNFQNNWIIKSCKNSAAMFKSIISNDYQSILKYASKELIIQKYVERIFICQQQQKPQFWNNKKFKLCVWILVKSFSPLQAYKYRNGYLQLSLSDEELKLANFPFNNIKVKKNGNTGQEFGCKLSIFKQFCDQTMNIKFDEKIQPKIDQLLTQVLKSVQFKIQQHPQCFEIYEFKIGFDSNLNPYLFKVKLNSTSKKMNILQQNFQRKMFISTLHFIFYPSAKKNNKWERLSEDDASLQISYPFQDNEFQ